MWSGLSFSKLQIKRRCCYQVHTLIALKYLPLDYDSPMKKGLGICELYSIASSLFILNAQIGNVVENSNSYNSSCNSFICLRRLAWRIVLMHHPILIPNLVRTLLTGGQSAAYPYWRIQWRNHNFRFVD